MMKALRGVLIAAALTFMGAPPAHALLPFGGAGARNTGFTVMGGYDGSWLYYQETDSSGNVMDRDYGWLNGLYGEARFEGNVLWTRLSAGYSWSHGARYDGAYQNGTPLKMTTYERIGLYEADIGVKLFNAGSATLTPYAGIGRRIWWRGADISPDYVEKYSWYYAAIGLNYVWRIEKWTAGADAAVALPFNMRMMTNEAGTINETTFRLGENPGVEVQFPFTYDVYKRNRGAVKVFLFLTPYFQRWQIGASAPLQALDLQTNKTETLYEPDSTAHLYGFRVGLGVNF